MMRVCASSGVMVLRSVASMTASLRLNAMAVPPDLFRESFYYFRHGALNGPKALGPRPLLEEQAAVHVAKAEGGLDDVFEGLFHHRVRDAGGDLLDLRVHVLGVDGGMHVAVGELVDDGHGLKRP